MVPTLLLVEDDADHAELFRRAFESHSDPYRLKIVDSLAAARCELKRAPPSLMVADQSLPDGDGLDLLPDARQAHVPVMILTSRGNERLAVEALKAGALDYVIKPSDTFADLPHRATQTLREWNIRQVNRQLEWELRELFEQSHSLLCLLTAEFRLQQINPAVQRMLGWPTEGLLGTFLLELFHPADEPAARSWFEQRQQGAGAAEFLIRCRTAQSDYRILEWTAVGGREGLMVATAIDVTDRVEHEQEERLRVDATARLSVLTSRERQVLQRVIEGLPNKAIAVQLRLNEKTIEKHRSRMMRKLKCRNLPALVQLMVLANGNPALPS